MKAAFSPNKTLDTIDNMTDVPSGLSTISIAKKHPSIAVATYMHSKTSEGNKQEKKVS
jgi:hypothetical protein